MYLFLVLVLFYCTQTHLPSFLQSLLLESYVVVLCAYNNFSYNFFSLCFLCRKTIKTNETKTNWNKISIKTKQNQRKILQVKTQQDKKNLWNVEDVQNHNKRIATDIGFVFICHIFFCIYICIIILAIFCVALHTTTTGWDWVRESECIKSGG